MELDGDLQRLYETGLRLDLTHLCDFRPANAEEAAAFRLRLLSVMCDRVERVKDWIRLIDLEAMEALQAQEPQLRSPLDERLRLLTIIPRTKRALPARRRLPRELSEELRYVFPFGPSTVLLYAPELIFHPVVAWGLQRVRDCASLFHVWPLQLREVAVRGEKKFDILPDRPALRRAAQIEARRIGEALGAIVPTMEGRPDGARDTKSRRREEVLASIRAVDEYMDKLSHANPDITENIAEDHAVKEISDRLRLKREILRKRLDRTPSKFRRPFRRNN